MCMFCITLSLRSLSAALPFDTISFKSATVYLVRNGHIPPLPCLMANAGTHEHGETFTLKNFHYRCHNGTAEVVACIADDQSVIQLGRTFIKNGMKHKCSIVGDSVTYEQEAMCFDNGVHYSIGDIFRNGSFRLTCGQDGIVIEGCYLQNSIDYLMTGESRIIGRERHECEMLGDGKVRYQVKVIGCVWEGEHYSIGQVFTDKHVRYQCKNDGSLDVLGCVDDGVFLDLGRDLLMNGMVHRCYRVGTTTIYHKCVTPSCLFH
uniref:Beta_helix domain-containing protein n=1 Tax=Angiostrongylus cantonensis TaxID=6313 RepID=A0A158PAC8_ANGCA